MNNADVRNELLAQARTHEKRAEIIKESIRAAEKNDGAAIIRYADHLYLAVIMRRAAEFVPC